MSNYGNKNNVSPSLLIGFIRGSFITYSGNNKNLRTANQM